MKRCWVEIDLNALRNNYRVYKSLLRDDMKIMAVVKADAYGHGDVEVARALMQEGCTDFAVSNINEAVGLRESGVKGQILILGYTPASMAAELVKYDITQALLSEEHARALADTGIKGIKTQFAIDTGMNRIGLDADEPDDCESLIRRFGNCFEMTGVFTHLCAADTPSEQTFTDGQISKFKNVVSRIKDMNLPYIHCMNSAGGLWQEPYGCFARLGIVLYGIKPDIENEMPKGIRQVMKWKSVVSMVKDVHAGESIGYGREYKVFREMRVATVPVGYADGFNRLLSGRGKVFIAGKPAKVLGRVCMDQIMVDVSDIPEAKYEAEVELIGEHYDADAMASEIGVIGYTIVCNISKRVDRVYIN
ncbi:MAG: alanine racemase [Lachnospiraceae bacterium]|nr:alanine racemase [Lachnospiraceae bacterium]